MHCRSQGGVVQCAAISSSQCQSSNVTQPSHLHVVTRHGAAQRRPAKVSCRHLAAGVKRSRRKTVSRSSMHGVSTSQLHHRSPADNSRHRQSSWCNVWRAGHEQQPTWTLRTPTRPLLPPRCGVANILPQQYQFINICYLNHKETSE